MLNKEEDWIKRLIEVMAHLRSPEGCPWDREQTHSSLKPYLMEECAEFLDAVDNDDAAGMKEELGDVLLQIIFQSQIAEESGLFKFNDVAEVITRKMLRRHPHVFGELEAGAADDVVDIWEEIKKQEKGGKEPESVLDGVPRHMPALLRAEKIQKKAAKAGFEWRNVDDIFAKIEEELQELKQAYHEGQDELIDEEIGDLVFAIVNLNRFRKKTSTEELVAKTIKKFQQRLGYVEKRLKRDGRQMNEVPVDELVSLWNLAKQRSD